MDRRSLVKDREIKEFWEMTHEGMEPAFPLANMFVRFTCSLAHEPVRR